MYLCTVWQVSIYLYHDYVHTYIRTCVCTYVHKYVHMYVDTWVLSIYTYVESTCIHMYMHTYSTTQFKIDRMHVWHGLNIYYTFFYFTYVHKIDDIESIIQSTCVHTRCVHDSLQTHACNIRTHQIWFACTLAYVHSNYKPRKVE